MMSHGVQMKTTIKIGDKVIKAEKRPKGIRDGVRYVVSKTPTGIKASMK